MNPITPAAFALSLLTSAIQAPEQNENPLKLSAAGALDGYTLVAPLNSAFIHLVDMQGKDVHQWKTNVGPGGGLYMLDNGHLLFCGRVDDNPRYHGGGIAGLIQEIDWDGNVVWQYKLSDEGHVAHHDVSRRANGNILLIAWEGIPREDAIEFGRDPAHTGGEGLWTDSVLEIRPVKPEGAEVVWEWHAWDHLAQDFDKTKANYRSIPDHPELLDINVDHRDQRALTPEEKKKKEELEKQMRAVGYTGGNDPDPQDGASPPAGGPPPGSDNNPDWMHTNAIKYLEDLDLIVLSSPHLSEIFVIDRSTTTVQAASHAGGRYGKGGDLLYRWGNPKNYGAGDEADRKLYYQHDVRWIPSKTPGELRILVFNNGQSRPEKEYSSVEELVLPFDSKKGFTREAGKPFGPAAPVWIYSDPGTFLSPFISGAQRLANGNTLICSGAQARIFEVTADKRIVWDYANPFGGDLPSPDSAGRAPQKAMFRATRIAKDHPGLANLKL